jgi:excisionase family DNA binding protein
MSENTVWLDVHGMAQRARVSRATILRELRRGRLRGVKVAGRKCWRSRPEYVDEWLEGQQAVNHSSGRRHGDR